MALAPPSTPQPPGDDYFSLFGLPIGFDLDPNRLASVYRDLQRSVHPDRYAGATDRERRLSVQQAARVNDAYRVLKDPLRRARYLLDLQGVDTREETNTAMDAGFLMEQLEWRERLEEADRDRDPASALAAIAGALEERRKDMIERMAGLFRESTGTALDHAAETVRRLRFVDRLREEIAAREDRLLD